MRFFNRITLQTPESVELEFTLAGIGNRAYALFIDYLAWGLLLTVLSFFAIFLNWYISSFEENLRLWFFAIELFIGFCLYVGYFIFFEVLWQGQTPGKRFVKIRVICDDGKPVRLQQATLRALLRPIDDLFFIGVFFIALGKQEKRIGDLVAGTIVIQDEQVTIKSDFAIDKEAQILADRLKQEVDFSRLSPENFAVIRDFLQRRDSMIPKAKYELSRNLAQQVTEILALNEIPTDVSANLFLEAVYLAYQQQSN